MEGNRWQEDFRRRSPPSAAHIDCNRDLTRSNSDASSLTVENCKDISRRSANATPDYCSLWTDEKHNLYLHHLEVSFVEQLYQLKSSFGQCSEQNQRDINILGKQMINVNNESEQFNVLRNGCWQKINYLKGESRSSSTSADSHTSRRCRRMYDFKHTGMHGHPSSTKIPAFHGKGVIVHGIPACSQEFPSSIPNDGGLFDLMKEGTGQNFLDEGSQSRSNFEAQEMT